MADWDDHAAPHQRQIIRHGTSHHAFTSTAVSLIIQAVESDAHVPPQVMGKMKNWIDSAVSAIDERYFDNAFKSKAEQMDAALNGIVNKALNHFT